MLNNLVRASAPAARAMASAKKPFDKILIANRGEIACRVMRSAKKLGIKTVAVHSDVDLNAPHVRQADESVLLGGAASADSYLQMDRIIEACKLTGAQAVHPGYGFLSENSHFAALLEKNGIAFIGPKTHAIDVMGDKIQSKLCAIDAGVNTIPGVTAEVDDVEEVVRISQDIGYPVMIKASAGGGGKGMRVAHNDDEAREGFRLSKTEAAASFGDDRIFIEKFISNPRHIEIQVLADSHGNYVYLNERECSIQRRNQKVLEEAPSSFVTPELREAMGKQACDLARACKYESAGTVEFLVDDQRNFYFLEMNTRLQVEHPITELITGVDLVEEMIKVAAGEKLDVKQEDLAPKGWATEARVYAEDPYRNFLPSIGQLTRYQTPTANIGDELTHIESGTSTVRCDTGVQEGSDISVYYDPMISKLIAHAPTRQQSIDVLAHALDKYVIQGTTHNVPFLRDVLDHPSYQSGDITTEFIPMHYPEGFEGHDLTEEEEINLVLVAAATKMECRELESDSVHVTLPSKKEFEVTPNVGGGVEVATEGKTIFNGSFGHTWDQGDAVFSGMRSTDDVEVPVLAQLESQTSQLTTNVILSGTHYPVQVLTPREKELFVYMPEPKVVDTSNALVSPMFGAIVGVSVKPGDVVQDGQELAVVEAMKMQNILRAPRGGVVKTVKIVTGDSVVTDDILIEFEVPEAEEE